VNAPWPGDVEVVADADAAALAAAERIAWHSARAVAARGRFTIALAGGKTPAAAYAHLARRPLRDTIAWPSWEVFFGDERWVPRDHPDSNFAMASRAFLAAVPLEAGRVHPIPTGAPSPDAAAAEYDSLMRSTFGAAAGATPRIDLVLLGMGEDGHTASLFPGSPLLAEGSRLFGAALRPGDGTHRVSAAPPLILAARTILVLVTGSAKRATLARAWDAGAAASDLPITLVRDARGGVAWICDSAAAPLASGAAALSRRVSGEERASS